MSSNETSNARVLQWVALEQDIAISLSSVFLLKKHFHGQRNKQLHATKDKAIW